MDNDMRHVLVEVTCQSSCLERCFELKLVRVFDTRPPRCVVEFCGLGYEGPRDHPRRRSIGAGYVDHYLSRLRDARVPLWCDSDLVHDSNNIVFRLCSGSWQAEFCWSGELPKGYELLAEFANQLLAAAGVTAYRF